MLIFHLEYFDNIETEKPLLGEENEFHQNVEHFAKDSLQKKTGK